MSIFTWFGDEFHKIVGSVQSFFKAHGEEKILDYAKTAVTAVENELKIVVKALEGDASKIGPEIITFLSKFEPDIKKIEAFVESLEPYISAVVPDFHVIWSKVAVFITNVMNKESGTLDHLLNLAVEWAYALFVKSAPK